MSLSRSVLSPPPVSHERPQARWLPAWLTPPKVSEGVGLPLAMLGHPKTPINNLIPQSSFLSSSKAAVGPSDPPGKPSYLQRLRSQDASVLWCHQLHTWPHACGEWRGSWRVAQQLLNDSAQRRPITSPRTLTTTRHGPVFYMYSWGMWGRPGNLVNSDHQGMSCMWFQLAAQ